MFKIKMKDGEEFNVLKIRKGLYEIQDWEENCGFASREFGPEVKNIDTQSDAFTCFRISLRVEVNGVEFHAYTGGIDAPNIKAVKEAAALLKVSRFDNDDM